MGHLKVIIKISKQKIMSKRIHKTLVCGVCGHQLK